jgi:2-hydroxychromene-2-carboxylate isomerase
VPRTNQASKTRRTNGSTRRIGTGISMRSIKVFFDPVSPYGYFAFNQLPQIAEKHNVTFNSVPVLLAGLLNAHGQKGPAEIEAKRRNMWLDCLRLSQIKGIPFSMPPAHPFNPLLASRMITAVDDDKHRFMYSANIIQACWAKGKDMTDSHLLIDLANHIGLDGLDLHDKSSSEVTKKKLKDHTDQALAMGIFGVPSFYVNESHELFWGSDRLD